MENYGRSLSITQESKMKYGVLQKILHHYFIVHSTAYICSSDSVISNVSINAQTDVFTSV